MVRPTLAPLIILKTMNTNKAIIGIIVCLLLFAIIPVECEAVQFKSRLMKKKEAEGTKYLKSAAELQLHIDDLANVFAGIIEQAADQVIAASKNFLSVGMQSLQTHQTQRIAGPYHTKLVTFDSCNTAQMKK